MFSKYPAPTGKNKVSDRLREIHKELRKGQILNSSTVRVKHTPNGTLLEVIKRPGEGGGEGRDTWA